MPFYPNTYPEASTKFASLLKKQNRNPLSETTASHFLIDSIDINYRVQGILDSTTTEITKVGGYKYILGDDLANLQTAVRNDISNFWRTGELGDIGQELGINDIIVWNDAYDADGDGTSEGAWELVFSASNSAFGVSGGAFVYSIADGEFYGFTGGGWGQIGAASEGPRGNTGESIVFGRGYTGRDTVGEVDSNGEVFVDSALSAGVRRVLINRYSNDTTGYGGASGDLVSVFYPFGYNATYNDRNPVVNLFLYNETTQNSFGVRIRAKHGALNANNCLDFQDTSDFSLYEIILSEPGTGTWDPAWGAVNEKIVVLAIADGALGETGAEGPAGQGIRIADESPIDNELYIQYIGSDGEDFGDPVATGIVSGTDGTPGDPGEVGYEMTFTGGSETDWSDQIYSTGTALTAGFSNGGVTLNSGEIHYVSNFYVEEEFVDGIGLTGTTQDYILVSHVASDASGNPVTYLSFGLNNAEYQSGVKYNRPGEVYFYEKEDYQLKLRSFVKYENVIGGENRVVLKNVDDDRDGVSSIGFSNGDVGFVLPVPRGIRGTGITFGTVINNELYLDYIDSQGATFGRFASGIKGLTGNQGTLNPFNIPYAITADGGINENGTISVLLRDVNYNAVSVRVDGLDRNGVDVSEYVQFGLGANVNKGYFTIFDETDVSRFGIFRYTALADDSGDTTFTGTHVAGPLSAIYDFNGTEGTTGLALGSNVLFALNLDGIQGQSGITGVGFTYGNEYFVSNEKPTIRTNGDPLEIGDKWFNSAMGLEFTFLGATGVEGALVTSPTGDGIRWVQTNNARQGRRGPQGVPGTGSQGIAGATGINYRGTWSPANVVYNPRDIVFINKASALFYASNPENVNNNWNSYFGVYGGVAAGVFINLTQHTSSSATVPGSQNLNSGTYWRPLVFSSPGLTGSPGPIGIHGTDVTGPSINDSGDLILKIRTYDETGSYTESQANAGYVRGPLGPTGPVGGSPGQYLYNLNNTESAGNSRLVLNNGEIVLSQFRQPISIASYVSGAIDINTTNSNAHIFDFGAGSTDVNSISFSGNSTDGSSNTIYFIGAAGATFNNTTSSGLAFRYNGALMDSVYISKQSAVSPTRLTAPGSGQAAVMAFVIKDSVLFVNYNLMNIQS